MIVYNIGQQSLNTKIMLGVTCTYLAIVVTLIGVIEIIIKLYEIIFQKVENEEEQEIPDFIKNANNQVIKCNIGRPNLD